MLLLIPSSIFFVSVIVLFILFFKSSSSLLYISCIFSIYASTLFLRFWIIFTIITLNSFQVDCLSPLHLIFLVSFYFVFSFVKFFPVVSFCVTFCIVVSFPQAAGSYFLFWNLPSGDCGWSRAFCRPLVTHQRWILPFWWTGPCQGVCFWGSCELSIRLVGILSSDGSGCVPVLVVVWPEAFQHWRV